MLDGRWADVRRRAREGLPAAWCAPTDHLPTAEHRALTLDRLRSLGQGSEHRYGFSSAFGGGDSTGAQTVQFEMLGHVDMSLAIKAGVQWGLFAGSIQALGTAGHHARYLSDAIELRTLGCFAMTETGHGSDVASLRTTATFDPATDSLVIHTPEPSARKDYIGNAAADARLAVVFAQLVVGAQRHGVHAVVVPIRDEVGQPMPGVTLSDCGRKAGLNGVDNGRIVFDHVRVPRADLLDRFGGLAADGTYTSSASSANARFFTTLGALVKGRVCLSASSLAATRTALAIALTHAERRQQFPRARVVPGAPSAEPAAVPEVTLLDYRTHQRRLLPALATTVVLTLAQEELTANLHRVTNPVLLGGAPDPAAQRELEAEAAGLKAMATWHATATIAAAREACGGAGYLSENRLAQLKADTDVFTTFEGDNTVLVQLLAKHLLAAHRDALAGAGRLQQARTVGAWMAGSLAGRTPARAVVGLLGDVGSLRRDGDPGLGDRAWQLRTLKRRERHVRDSLVMRLRGARSAGADPFEATNEMADHLVLLARVHLDVVVARAADAAARAAADARTSALLSALLDLHVLARLEADRGWYVERGWFSPARSKALVGAVNSACAQLRPHAMRVVEGFGLPQGWLGAVIAS